MDNIMLGIDLSKKIEEEIKQSIKGCIIRPSVALIEIGKNDESEYLINKIEEACNRVGIYFRYHQFEEDTPELTIINKVKELDNDDYVNGIKIQLPIPEKYNEKRLLNTIINSKDIDGLTDINVGRLISGRKTIIPSSALAIMSLLKEYNIDLSGKNVTVIGRGKRVGRPIVNVLLNEDATVTICHSKTSNLKKFTSNADIVISATGVKNLITKDMIKENAIVIDAGLKIEDGMLLGDVDFDSVKEKASLITPVKDGLLPVCISMFLKNALLCYNNNKK